MKSLISSETFLSALSKRSIGCMHTGEMTVVAAVSFIFARTRLRVGLASTPKNSLVELLLFTFHFKIFYPGYKFSINILFYNWPCKKLLTKLEKKGLSTTKFTIKGVEYVKIKDM